MDRSRMSAGLVAQSRIASPTSHQGVETAERNRNGRTHRKLRVFFLTDARRDRDALVRPGDRDRVLVAERVALVHRDLHRHPRDHAGREQVGVQDAGDLGVRLRAGRPCVELTVAAARYA